MPLEELGVALEDDEAPPPAWSFFSMELEDEELEGDGVDGVLVAPDEDEDGEVDGVVVLDEAPVAARSLPARSHAVSRLAPSAMETAIAMVESFMWPPWLGYWVSSKDRAGRPVLEHPHVTHHAGGECAFRTDAARRRRTSIDLGRRRLGRPPVAAGRNTRQRNCYG